MNDKPTPKLNLPRGIRNNNPGNLIYIADPRRAWNGQCGQDGALAIYVDMLHGVRASGKELIAGFKQAWNSGGRDGEDTVAEIITEWAPPNENDTEAYIASVCMQTGFTPRGVLHATPEILFALLKAIFRHENGGHFVLDDTIRAGVDLALST